MPADRIHTALAAPRAEAALAVGVAVAAVLLRAPTVVATVLCLAAVTAVTARLAGRRGRGPADTVLVGVGGVLVAVVLTGLALDLVGVPLERRGWAVALGVLGLVGAVAPLPARPASSGPAEPASPQAGRPLLRQLPWALACMAVAAVAITSSVQSAGSVDVAPVALSLGQVGGGHARVVVESERATGLLELRTDSGAGATLSYPLFRLAAGGSLVTDVLLPAAGRTTITVSNPGQSQPLRSLIVGS